MPKFVLLWTDAAIWLLLVALVAYGVVVMRSANLRASWRKVFEDAPAFASAVVLAACLVVTLLDSVHFRPRLPPAPGAAVGQATYDTRTASVLDVVLAGLVESREATYSRPLEAYGFTKESVVVNGETRRVPPRLQFGGAHLKDPASERAGDIARRSAVGIAAGLAVALLVAALVVAGVARASRAPFADTARAVVGRRTRIPWLAPLATLVVLGAVVGWAVALMNHYHVLGTDLTGNDVLYQSLKSIRTAFVIGTLATVATLPVAIVLGIMAGFLRGWVDEAVQYVYTVFSSVPNVLLIAACVLMVQVYLDKNPQLFDTSLERADLKLFLLCAVLGLTNWPGLARLLRGEAMKLRELEYVQAATAFGVGRGRIMVRHIFPNVAHLVLIVTVLDFSSLILYEAVLSYVGVGVDPSMNSFGGMINLARTEMSRDPVVWWSFAAAFGFMVTLVLAANLFADGVRDAFDPRFRATKPRKAVAAQPATIVA